MRAMKKIIVSIIAFAMVATGMVYLATNVEEVKAEGSVAATLETGAVVLAAENVTKGEVPTANLTGYTDYLFAGWFKDTACENAVNAEEKAAGVDSYYAKFVPADTLSVKMQISNNKITDEENGVADQRAIRFISSVESLDLRNVGFVVEGMNENEPYFSNTVYERIESSLSDELDYEFSPKVVGTKAEYFVTAKLAVAENDTSLKTVTACWETLDGTVVMGGTRSVSLADKADNVINLVVEGELTEEDEGAKTTFTSGSVSVENASVEVLESSNGYSTVRITLPEETNVVNMKSATKINIVGSDSKEANGIFRNYYTTYAGTADTSWYDVNPDANEFVIASSADLWGLASLSNADTPVTFSGATIVMVRDIVLNEGTSTDGYVNESGTWVTATWETREGTTLYPWTPIAKTTAFAGTFDGDLNTIKGLYASFAQDAGTSTSLYTNKGLFGNISGTLKNLQLKNSFIASTGTFHNIGSIVGHLTGSLMDVYSDANITTTNTAYSARYGGIVGFVSGSTESIIKKCWYDGTVKGCRHTAGLVGTSEGYLIIEDSLCTGDVRSTYSSGTNNAYSGGLMGQCQASVSIKNCVMGGTFASTAQGGVGSVYAPTGTSGTRVLENVYTTETDGNTIVGIGIKNFATPEMTLKGQPMVVDSLNGADGYIYTELDFYDAETNKDGIWAAVDGKVPVLKQFYDGTIIENLKDNQRVQTGWYYNENSYAKGSFSNTKTSYNIDNVNDLYGFADIVTNGKVTFVNQTVQLTKTIDINPEWNAMTDDVADAIQWNTTIGEDSSGTNVSFNGTFNGKGYSIRGLCISSSKQSRGLFGNVSGKIMNLVLENSVIDGGLKTGSIVGQLQGIVENVYVDKTVTVIGKRNTGSTGGVVGHVFGNEPSIKKCWFAGKIETSLHRCGGIVGRVYNTSCLTMEDCLFTGEIVSTTTSGSVGGMIGKIEGGTTYELVVKRCLSAGDISTAATSNVGNLLGYCNVTVEPSDLYYVKDRLVQSKGSDITVKTLDNETGVAIEEDATVDGRTLFSGLFLLEDGTTENTAWTTDSKGMPIINTSILAQ